MPRSLLPVVLVLASASTQADVIKVPEDVATIADALGIAEPGDQVLVAPGTYFEGDLVITSGITLSGSGADVTVVDATGGRWGIKVYGTDAVLIEGLTFRGAEYTGMEVEFSFRVEVRGCRVVENNGAGLDLFAGSSLVRDCQISNNTGNGIQDMGTDLLVQDCEVIDNGRFGILVDYGPADIVNSDIAGHSEAGIHLNGFYGGTVRGCRVRGNGNETRGLGGIVILESNYTIESCVVSENLAISRGGGMSIQAPDCVVRNCTIVRNRSLSASDVGGVAFWYLTTFERNIVAFSEVGSGVGCFGEADFTFVCCDIYGNAGGDLFCQPSEDSFQLDPMFCDPANGDYTLDVRSPCAEGNHPNSPDCGLIGALDVGCGATPTRHTSWGGIKNSYR